MGVELQGMFILQFVLINVNVPIMYCVCCFHQEQLWK